MENKKMAFYEICDGDYAKKMQFEFELGQYIANESKRPVKITSVITITPSKPDEETGKLNYNVKSTKPGVKSDDYITELKNGVIINDGKDIAALLQISLEFDS